MTQQRMSSDEQGTPIMQGTRRPVRGQSSVWDEDPAQVSPPPYRIARASLPAQEQRRRQQQPPHGGASRHYAGHSHTIHPEDQPYVTDEGRGGLVSSRVPARATSAIDEGLADRPAPTSARRYRGSTMTTEQQRVPVARYQRRLLHGTVYIGLTLLCMLVGFVLFSALSVWWQHTDDYLRYGMPRTFQMDAVVGHQDSAAHPSHFLALNLDGHLSVIEMQGGDLGKTVIYAGPVIYGQGADLVAETLSVAHDQRGQPELVLHYQNNEVILYNGKDGKFHLQPQA
jgi:hypothetical protein